MSHSQWESVYEFGHLSAGGRCFDSALNYMGFGSNDERKPGASISKKNHTFSLHCESVVNPEGNFISFSWCNYE